MNNTFFVLALFALLTIVALSVVTIYNYISCFVLKRIYDEILLKEKNNKVSNNKTQLILESNKIVNKPNKANQGTTIKCSTKKSQTNKQKIK